MGLGAVHSGNDVDIENGNLEGEKDRVLRSVKSVKIPNQALLSGMAYCISSCSMILINKCVLSSYDFNAGISLMLYQNFVSVMIVSMMYFLGVISTEPLTWRLIKVWFPVNLLFVGMLITSMFRRRTLEMLRLHPTRTVTIIEKASTSYKDSLSCRFEIH